MPDIFDEVAEDLRAERARKLWARYGSLVLAALFVVLAGVGGYQGWRWYEAREAERAATAFMAAHRAAEAEGADLKAMAQRFEEASRGAPAGYRDMQGSALRRLRLKPANLLKPCAFMMPSRPIAARINFIGIWHLSYG